MWRRFLSLSLVLLLATALFVLWSGKALADGPGCWEYDFTQGTAGWYAADPNTYYVAGQGWGSNWDSNHVIIATDLPYDASIDSVWWQWSTTYGGWMRIRLYLDEELIEDTGSFNVGGGNSSYLWETIDDPTADRVQINSVLYGSDRYITHAEICYSDFYEPPPPLTCSTVPDADFDIDGGPWTLAGTASITQSTATLPPGSAVSQNVSLSANKTYNAVISATVTNSVELVAGLGFGENSDNETLTISSSGWYTATLSTPSNLSGAIAYTLLNNDATDSINIGFTCLYLSSEEIVCLAPINGTFESDAGWIWQRGATWRQPAKQAYLPYSSKGLISASNSYEFPELDEGQYLLMGFDALGEGDDSGVISGRARSGFNDIVYNYQAFPTFYRYEMDLTGLAGMTTTLAFANPGADGIEGVVSSANVELDNICVFVSDRPLQLPHPVDPDGITPVELGFNYTSCDDIDGILAGWGVNIQQYRAEYLAGASLWDPIGWVPWLIAAMWNILATYLCIFMAAFVTLIDILEYIINNFLNIGNWLVRSIQTLPAFLSNVLSWLTNTASNIGSWWGTTLIALAIWWVASGGNIFAFFGLVFNSLWLALKNWAGWFPSFEPVLRQNSLNGFRGIANVFMAGRNALLSSLGPALSNPINAAFLAWNALSPFFTSVSGFLAIPGLLFGLGLLFFSSVFDLVLMFAAWVWENVFMVASLPFQFYYAFDNGLNSTAYNALVNCAGTNFWCTFLSGVQLINQLVSHTVLYPIVITGIIIGTFVVFGRHLWALFTIEVK